ncbi:MAG: hypothetical protein PHY95_00350 [Candidatus ainarchaeum sp.]|nr:hypothetical protein [Candidatus ainarchaeum sp.]
MKKTLLFMALVLCVSFAEVVVTQAYEGNLYTPNTPPAYSRVHMEPFLYFEDTLVVSTDSRVIYGGPADDLQQDAIICEGDVTTSADADGEWAHGGFYQHVYYLLPCEPPSYSRVSNNVPIFWDADSYDALFPEDVCNEGEPGCWGMEGSPIRQRVDVYEKYDGSVTYSNREGQTNVVCKGVTTLRYDGTLLDSSVIGDAPTGGSMRLTHGMHTITNGMDVQGCLGVTRNVACDATSELSERVFGRTSAQFGSGAPGYSTSLQSTMNLRVVTDADLRCSAEAVSVTPSPVNVSPGATQRITITVRNACPSSDPLCQPITVTGVTASNGFRFNFDTGGMLVPLGYYTVNPGQAKTFNGILTAPAYTTCPTRLTFTAAYTCPGCTGTFSGTPATVNIPFDCPPPPETEENITNLVPSFTPDLPTRVDIETGGELDFSVITWNNGQNTSNPGETCVNIGNWMVSGPIPGPSIRIFLDLPGISPIRYSYGAIPPGGSVVHEPISFACTPAMENMTYVLIANVDCIPPGNGTTTETDESDNIVTRVFNCRPATGNETEHEGEYNCDISPSFQTGYPLGTYSFHVTCPDEGNPDDMCGGSIDWDSSSRNVTYTGSDDLDFYRITVGGATLPGSVTIEANVRYDDGNATCRAELNVPTVPCEEFV